MIKKTDYKKQAEEYLAGWKRAKADLANYQKRVDHDRAEWGHFAKAECVKRFLPLLDSLEAGSELEGVEKIHNQMLGVLKEMEVEAIKTIGEPVNPEFHEVIATEDSEDHASGIIVQEAQRGYKMHGRVLRVAKVIVSK